MLTVRLNTFETNSSSVHTLVIPKDTKITIPNRVTLFPGEYGWGPDEVYNTMDYIYTACKDRGQDEVEKFLNYLKNKGIEEIECRDADWFYVDHEWDLPLDDLFSNEDLLDRFLFGEDSYITIDNDEYSVYGNEEYNPEEYDIIVK